MHGNHRAGNLRCKPPLRKAVYHGLPGWCMRSTFASISSLGATGTGVTGIFGILLCLNNPVGYILMFAIAFGVAFVLTWMFGYKDEVQKQLKKY